MFGMVAGGLLVRFASLGLPRLVVKYGGSALWALMTYWMVSTVFACWRPYAVALLAATLATAIEFLKLVHAGPLEALRHTLAGILLLGRYFSVWDLVAYGLAIAVGVLIDRRLR